MLKHLPSTWGRTTVPSSPQTAAEPSRKKTWSSHSPASLRGPWTGPLPPTPGAAGPLLPGVLEPGMQGCGLLGQDLPSR